LPVLDGLHDLRDRISFIVCRQEGGASYMAEAYGKLAGEPGVLFVTRGPGATNGAIGVHTGFQDSTPMVVFIGQVGNEFAEREAFQEIDYRRMYGQMAKWVAQIDRVERIPEYVSRAFHTAMAGRPGPVILALPEDTLFAEAAVADVRATTPCARRTASEWQNSGSSYRGAEAVRHPRRRRLDRATPAAAPALAEKAGLPVGTAFRCQDLFDNRSPNYCRRCRHRRQSEARPESERRRCPARHRRAARRDDDGRLFARRGAAAATNTDPHPCGARKSSGGYTGPRCRSTRAMRSSWMRLREVDISSETWKAQSAAARKEYLEWTEPRPMPGKLQYGEVVRWLLGPAAGRRDHRRAAPATSRAGCTATSDTRVFAPSSDPTNGSMG
jgi:acetolactate synthase-1/2/3 large subunit